jgi:hypothetical protein
VFKPPPPPPATTKAETILVPDAVLYFELEALKTVVPFKPLEDLFIGPIIPPFGLPIF